MAGMGLEGAYGAAGTMAGVRDWIEGRRRKVVQGQRDEDRLRDQRLQDEALATEAADRETDLARQKILDTQRDTTFAQGQEDRNADIIAAAGAKGEQEGIIDMIRASDWPEMAKTGAIWSVHMGKGLPAEAYESLKKTAPKLQRVETVEGGRPVTKFLPEDQVAGQTYEQYRAPVQGRQGPQGSPQWVKPADGGPAVYRLPQPGDAPMNSREQGRPVNSGDARRISDMDTSLGLLDTLEKNLPPGTTGQVPWLSALVPNAAIPVAKYVPGLDPVGAKGDQATIDLVKQVIGKSLEEGVLRKEDEIKYAKILPVIGEDPEVVASKIAGLRQLIHDKRGNLLDNLGNANYDTTKFATPGVTAPGKTVTRAQLAALAQKKGTDAATQAARAEANGYTVID